MYKMATKYQIVHIYKITTKYTIICTKQQQNIKLYVQNSNKISNYMYRIVTKYKIICIATKYQNISIAIKYKITVFLPIKCGF